MLVNVPGQVTQETKVAAEVQVLRPPDFPLVWRAMTDTGRVRNKEQAADELAMALVRRLEKDGILAR